jgi:hypothetical protein
MLGPQAGINPTDRPAPSEATLEICFGYTGDQSFFLPPISIRDAEKMELIDPKISDRRHFDQ